MHGFYNWVFDALEVLNVFVREVVTSRKDAYWARWMREDLDTKPYHWLRADFVPPSPLLVFVG